MSKQGAQIEIVLAADTLVMVNLLTIKDKRRLFFLGIFWKATHGGGRKPLIKGTLWSEKKKKPHGKYLQPSHFGC